jgi:hypothetical protein
LALSDSVACWPVWARAGTPDAGVSSTTIATANAVSDVFR